MPEPSAFSQQAACAQRYAPRPLRRPVGSGATWPSGVRTTRWSPRFVSCVRQATHIRCGTCFGRGPFCRFRGGAGRVASAGAGSRAATALAASRSGALRRGADRLFVEGERLAALEIEAMT